MNIEAYAKRVNETGKVEAIGLVIEVERVQELIILYGLTQPKVLKMLENLTDKPNIKMLPTPEDFEELAALNIVLHKSIHVLTGIQTVEEVRGPDADLLGRLDLVLDRLKDMKSRPTNNPGEVLKI